jgi:hypothetical protein
MFALRTESAVGRLPRLARWYLAWQVLLPAIAWIVGTQRFAWAMYSQFRPPPGVLVQRQAGGPFEPLDLARTLGHVRGDLDYSGTFVGELCRRPGILTVRLIPTDQGPVDHPC